MISEVTNEDCMLMMARYPDKFFDLAICDPPYGVGMGLAGSYQNTSKTKHKKKEWDTQTPNGDYFSELQRVSINQIIWGGNYFTEYLRSSRGWVYWDKLQTIDNYASGELAWTSFDTNLRQLKVRCAGFLNPDKSYGTKNIHPTQKPVKLYEKLLRRYAKPGDKILDTHLGSGSSRIAAYKLGFDFWATELDKDYFDAAEERFKKAIHEPLFQTQPEVKQNKFF